MKISLVDRLVAQVAPQHALQRVAARAKLDALAALPSFGAEASGYTSTAGTDSFLGRWFARPRSAAATTNTPSASANPPVITSAVGSDISRFSSHATCDGPAARANRKIFQESAVSRVPSLPVNANQTASPAPRRSFINSG